MAPAPEDRVWYRVFDPTGNITALVETAVVVERQPMVAASVMERHPEVEQVGFVTPCPDGDGRERASLRMAGGEFCGNASMCAASLCCLRDGLATEGEEAVWLRVSGAGEPVEVRLRREGPRFLTSIRMPRALGVEQVDLSLEGERGSASLVRLEGISHIVIEPSSAFHGLLERRDLAGRAVREWCEELCADGLGLMFVTPRSGLLRLDPLVYVRCGETLFWENSCASGSSAVGMLLARREGGPVDLALEEPGGTMRVTSDPASDVTWLCGSVLPVGGRRCLPGA